MQISLASVRRFDHEWVAMNLWDISPVTLDQARACFNALKDRWEAGGRRLSEKPLIDFLVAESLTLAAKHRLPVQFHTGLRDPDLDLARANPLHLRSLLEAPDWRDTPIVLLHAGYPFMREAGYLAAVYSQVYVDVGLTVPMVSIAGMQSVLRQLLELAPTTKLLFSSDARNAIAADKRFERYRVPGSGFQ